MKMEIQKQMQEEKDNKHRKRNKTRTTNNETRTTRKQKHNTNRGYRREQEHTTWQNDQTNIISLLSTFCFCFHAFCHFFFAF